MPPIIVYPQERIRLPAEGGCVGVAFGNLFEGDLFPGAGLTGGVDGSVGSFAEACFPIYVVFVAEVSASDGSEAMDHYISRWECVGLVL